MKRSPLVPTAATLLLAATVALGAFARVGEAQPPGPPPPPTAPPPAPAAPPPAPALTLTDAFAPIVGRVAPAVVSITATIEAPAAEVPRGLDPFFQVPEQPRRGRGVGSGVVVSADGFILTNNHVVADAERVRVTLSDGREFVARVVGTDPPTDIALIKIDARDLPFLEFGDSREVRVGEFALAVGNPFGLGQTVTLGIISAVGRGNVGIVDYEDFLQTDAAINPGNSGGALVNAAGELIGINTALVAYGGAGNQGVGFAVPSHMASVVMDQLRKGGRVVRGWLGVAIQDLTPALSNALGVKQASGALVGDVTEGGPAERGGLRRGDVIVEVNGREIDSSTGLRNQIAQTAPGTRVTLGVVRDGRKLDVAVKLGELPSELTPAGAAQDSGAPLGLELAPLTEAIRRELELPRGVDGAVVTSVVPGSIGAEAGLRPGDVVQEANRKPVTSARALAETLRRAKEPVLLLINRAGVTTYVLVRP